jgi:acyl-[acyl-carrier-protein] desaturase
MDPEQIELLATVEPAVEKLMAEHKERREHWYAHEYVPWEVGRSYRDEPWDESQCTISPEARTALVVNLLTEDNLPYYHTAIDHELRRYGDDSALARWNRLWTAEEGQHAIALRSYLLTTRNCDPAELEDDRMATMTSGFLRRARTPADIFIYTTLQELATRVSHRNAGRYADDPVAFEIMSRIATDENHHFLFYRGVVNAMLEVAPSLIMRSIYEQMANFEMPGTGIPRFRRRAVTIAKSGVYDLRIHHDRVVKPVLREWHIDKLEDLTPEAAQYQEKILALPALLDQRADILEKRMARG